MLKYVLNAISSATGFSKSESKGTLLLILIIFSAILGTNIYVTRLKNVEKGSVENAELAEWVKTIKESIKEKRQREVSNPKKYEPIKALETSSPEKKNADQNRKKYYDKIDKPAVEMPIRNINEATAEDLQFVKGIGKVYSQRIIKYRNRLGGFATNEQLKEVYGLSDETIEALLTHFEIQTDPTLIDINSDSARVLANHPYINYDLAWVIINFRKANGNIQTLEDLKEIKAINDSMLQRLKPYIF